MLTHRETFPVTEVCLFSKQNSQNSLRLYSISKALWLMYNKAVLAYKGINNMTLAYIPKILKLVSL